jgi:uncharacterized protein YndB with AHSA1/START domain
VTGPDTGVHLALQRHYPVAPEIVFQAFTDARWLERWFCPSPDVTMSVSALDVRVGGHYRFVFRFPEGRVAVRGEFRVVDRPAQLVFTWTWEPPDPHAGLETLVTVELRSVADGTELSLTHDLLPTEPIRTTHEDGWSATLDRLRDLLSERSMLPGRSEDA